MYYRVRNPDPYLFKLTTLNKKYLIIRKDRCNFYGFIKILKFLNKILLYYKKIKEIFPFESNTRLFFKIENGFSYIFR